VSERRIVISFDGGPCVSCDDYCAVCQLWWLLWTIMVI